MNDAATSLSALITSKRRLSAPEQIESTVHATDDETVSFNPRNGAVVPESVNDPQLRTNRDEFR